MSVEDALNACAEVRLALERVEVELLKVLNPAAAPEVSPPVDPTSAPAYNPGAAEAPQ